jgi:hypothetical protein
MKTIKEFLALIPSLEEQEQIKAEKAKKDAEANKIRQEKIREAFLEDVEEGITVNIMKEFKPYYKYDFMPGAVNAEISEGMLTAVEELKALGFKVTVFSPTDNGKLVGFHTFTVEVEQPDLKLV